jgi:hypothetical protein
MLAIIEGRPAAARRQRMNFFIVYEKDSDIESCLCQP